jgi:hypothetical protein
LQKRCINCGRYFIPDRRIGERQKVCGREACKRERKKKAQENWRNNNPEYFKNHYTDYVKPWRQKKRLLSSMGRPEVIKDKIPFLKPYQQLILLIPGDKTGMIKDEIRLRRVAGSTFERSKKGNEVKRGRFYLKDI